MSNQNTRVCTYCNTEKSWKWNGKKLKDGSKIYLDDNNKRWAGRRCPDCERSRVHQAVRCDSFEKEAIILQLEASGFNIISKSLPLKVEKDGETMTVGIKRAFTSNGQVVVESKIEGNADLYALVFESVRICSSEQMKQLAPKLDVYTPRIIKGATATPQ